MISSTAKLKISRAERLATEQPTITSSYLT